PPTRIPTSLNHPPHSYVHDVVRSRSQHSNSSRVLFSSCLRLDPFVYSVCVGGEGRYRRQTDNMMYYIHTRRQTVAAKRRIALGRFYRRVLHARLVCRYATLSLTECYTSGWVRETRAHVLTRGKGGCFWRLEV
ncbi:unnamed protein product, partial [Ectocarpus sp. 6 AP-2014]